MIIVADENIPYVREAFGAIGEVRTIAGRVINRDAVRDADLLLVRSITRVDSALLDGSKVRFVATATIGEDHIDRAFLDERSIGFASAPGSNADSVAEYVVAALLRVSLHTGRPLRGATLGIVGVGNVGGRVRRAAEALGMTCILNDPPLQRKTGSQAYRPLEDALACDYVTLHVPLNRQGRDATYHLLDRARLDALRPGATLINTSRGPVIDNVALEAALASDRLGPCVLDVWEGEPRLRPGLLERVLIGTPHIAGYSFDGKVNGTRQIHEAACTFLGRPAAWDPKPLLPKPEVEAIDLAGIAETDRIEAILSAVVEPIYDIRADDAALRKVLQTPEAEQGPYFDRLRKEYPRRREFTNTRILGAASHLEAARILHGLRFRVEGL